MRAPLPEVVDCACPAEVEQVGAPELPEVVDCACPAEVEPTRQVVFVGGRRYLQEGKLRSPSVGR